jgi:hypothetical protein
VTIPADAALAPLSRVALVAEIVITYARVRVTLRRRGLPGTVQDLRAVRAVASPGDPVATGRRLGRAVVRTLTPLPADSRCLMRSLVLTRLLARRGIETRLVIAVRAGGHFAAHAWIEHGDAPLLPAGAAAFEQLVKL